MNNPEKVAMAIWWPLLMCFLSPNQGAGLRLYNSSYSAKVFHTFILALTTLTTCFS